MWTLSMHAAQLAVSSRAPACCVASGAEDPLWKSNLVFCLARRGKAALCCPRAPIAGGKKTSGRVDESDVGLKSSS
jgi:hypothetical protein